MDLLASRIQDVAVIRRMLFAVSFLPPDYPHYWDTVTQFAFKGTKQSVDSAEAKVLMENIQFMQSSAFAQDKHLMQEIISCEDVKKAPIGIILISSKKVCCLCGGKLLTRGDRPGRVTLYTETLGTLPASSYRKYCQKNRHGCKLVQHYGYYTMGEDQPLIYDEDWADHQYFLSSQETAFETALLKRFDVELLIGQVSYKQKADIFNHINGYKAPKKQCKTLKEDTSTNNSVRYTY